MDVKIKMEYLFYVQENDRKETKTRNSKEKAKNKNKLKEPREFLNLILCTSIVIAINKRSGWARSWKMENTGWQGHRVVQ